MQAYFCIIFYLLCESIINFTLLKVKANGKLKKHSKIIVLHLAGVLSKRYLRLLICQYKRVEKSFVLEDERDVDQHHILKF